MVKKLLYLNGLAALNVVLYHATAWGYTAMFWWTHRYRQVSVPNFDQLGSPNYYVLRAIEQWVIFSIPAFLFVSGYFLAFAAGRSQAPFRWQVVLVRIKNLVIPFLLWSLIILGLDMAFGRDLSAREFVWLMVTGRAADPFYFVPVLVQLYLLSPLIIRFARTNWKLLLLITGALQVCVLALRYPDMMQLTHPLFNSLKFLNRSFLFPSYIFFFSLGMVFGFHLSSFKDWLFQNRWILLGITGFLFILGMVEWEMIQRFSGQDWIGPRETLLDQIYAASFLLTYFGFEKARLVFPALFNQLGTRSYGIYLVHTLALVYTSKAVYHLFPQLLGWVLPFQVVLIIAGLGMPLVMMELFDRSPFRKYYSLIFG
jgi:peptidoglycan/LPS O-acetylase OafA/YrhL